MTDKLDNIPELQDTDIIGQLIDGESGRSYWNIQYYDASYLFPLSKNDKLGISTIISFRKDAKCSLKDIMQYAGFFVADSEDGKVFIKHSPRAEHELEFYLRVLDEKQHPALMPLIDIIYRQVMDNDVETTRKYSVFPFITIDKNVDYSETLDDLITEIRIDDKDWTEDILKIGIQLTSFLAWMHDEHSAIHMDIKPRNVVHYMHGTKHLIKVIDFEGVKYGFKDLLFKRVIVRLSKDDIKLLTPEYSAPELLSSELRLHGESDVYSTACIIFDLFEGKRMEGKQDIYDELFDGDDAFEYSLLNARMPIEKNYARLRRYGFLTPQDAMEAKKVPVALRPVLAKCFELLPCDRYSARDLEKELKKVLTHYVTK